MATWSGTHPLESLYREAITLAEAAEAERDDWKAEAYANEARAERAEAELVEVKAGTKRLATSVAAALLDKEIDGEIEGGAVLRIAQDTIAELLALRAQLDSLQVAACPECGTTLHGRKLAPFGKSDAATAEQIQARCCHCLKPATIVRTYYDTGFPSAREHLCAEHSENHPFHGTAIPPVARPGRGGNWNDAAPDAGQK